MSRTPRRTRARFLNDFDSGFVIFFICIATLAVISGVSVLFEWQDCSAAGGALVKGFSWNGYVCVAGK